MHNIAEFAEEMRKVAAECMRVLMPGKHCAVLIGHEHLYVFRKPDEGESDEVQGEHEVVVSKY